MRGMEQVIVNQKFLETFGTRSLSGQLKNWPADEVELVFPQTSLSWRQDHNGPDNWIMPEYSIPCLIEDILSLISKGVKVSVIMKDVS